MAARAALRVAGAGHTVYAAAAAGLGVLLLSGEIVYVWAPVPLWVPWRSGLAFAAGGLMLASALLLSWRKTTVPASATLALLFLSWLLLLQVPRIIATPAAMCAAPVTDAQPSRKGSHAGTASAAPATS